MRSIKKKKKKSLGFGKYGLNVLCDGHEDVC